MFNRKHGRTGTLWDGRYKSCLVDSQHYLFTVYRYIELNPVRAALIEAPEHYRWSSVHANLALAGDPSVTPHPSYMALAADPQARGEVYRQRLFATLGDDEIQAIRMHMQPERVLGSPRFQAMIEKTLNRPVACRSRGRPPRIRDEFKR